MSVSSPAVFVVLGNEKGGVGKSTIAANLSVGIAKMGVSVGLLDLDGRQRTIACWHQRRIDASECGDVPMAIPMLAVTEPATFDSISLNEECDYETFKRAVAKLDKACDVIIADTPPGDNYLAQLSHRVADIVLTPVEDGVFDREVLFGQGAERLEGHKAKSYAATIEQARQMRHETSDVQFDWLVVQNRRRARSCLSFPHSSSARSPLDEIGSEMGFRTYSGLKERPVYRNLFASGRSVFDYDAAGPSAIGHAAVDARIRACEEVSDLISSLYLPFAESQSEMRAASRIG